MVHVLQAGFITWQMMYAHRTGEGLSLFEYHLTLTYVVSLLLEHCELIFSCGRESLPSVYCVLCTVYYVLSLSVSTI